MIKRKSSPIDILQSVYGYTSFRGIQEDIISRVMNGYNAVVFMPTGGGKSLCYQIPSILRDGVGIVISPLIALMHDQVVALKEMGVSAEYLNSSVPKDKISEIIFSLKTNKIDLLYISPERLTSSGFIEFLTQLKIGLIAIDEAHCVAQWGHDFRPDYLSLEILAQTFPKIPRMALTATADGPTRNEILSRLNFTTEDIFSTGFDRPNIKYTIVPKKDAKKQLLQFINNEHFLECGIVYRMSRKKVEETATWLNKNGIKALPYHAGLSPETRKINQRRFMSEDGIVMVATIAFGMGIDKPDVRFVAHMDLPKSIEAYYQETGRAGRDGLAAEAFLLIGLQDITFLKRMILSGNASDSRKALELRKLNSMLAYCESPGCLRQPLLAYFGEELTKPCGNCSTCISPPLKFDGTIAAQKALSNIYRTDQLFGTNYLIDILLGKETDRIKKLNHNKLSTFGIGTEFTKDEWLSIHRQLISQSMVDVDIEGYGALKLNRKSWQILKKIKKVEFRKDPVLTKNSKTKKKNFTIGDENCPSLTTPEASELLDSLRLLRSALASEQKVPAYVIFADKTLLELACYRPSSTGQLFGINGLGDQKIFRYGDIIIKTLAEHEKVYGRPENLPQLPEPKAKALNIAPENQNLTATILETYNLFEKYLNVEDVAQKRNLKIKTIYSHLKTCVEQNKLNADDILDISNQEITCIKETLELYKKEGYKQLLPVYEALFGNYSYEILRIISAENARDS
ncbi:DNA helicase RecQ [Maridesulfovibrio bastinii]|uniref:DNA helicase RecQ n=1 Tax=Maridesulfovibrio bastinii TaxID=47157 RepID=UPI0004285D63|nr:DNA helicase RecQ [Maridesulfovibrio bastinii]